MAEGKKIDPVERLTQVAVGVAGSILTLIIVAIWGWASDGRLIGVLGGATQADVESLAMTRLDVTAMQGRLATTQNELKITQDGLGATQADLKATQDDLAATQADLKAAQNGLAAAQADLKTTREFHYLGEIICGRSQTFKVPDDANTTTGDWMIFGIDPYINAEFENDSVRNNALLGFETTTKSAADGKAWTVSFNVRTNLATGAGHQDIADCNESTSRSGKSLVGASSRIHVVAIKKPVE